MEQSLLEQDWQSCQKYPAEKRSSYSLFYQLSRITRDRDSLAHDDRLDALAGSVRHWLDHLRQDTDKAVEAAKRRRYHEMIKDPLGNGRPLPGYHRMRGMKPQDSAVARMRRKV